MVRGLLSGVQHLAESYIGDAAATDANLICAPPSTPFSSRCFSLLRLRPKSR